MKFFRALSEYTDVETFEIASDAFVTFRVRIVFPPLTTGRRMQKPRLPPAPAASLQLRRGALLCAMSALTPLTAFPDRAALPLRRTAQRVS